LAAPATLAGDSHLIGDCRKIRQRFRHLVRSCNKLKQVIDEILFIWKTLSFSR
jgi:hypothetical protein